MTIADYLAEAYGDKEYLEMQSILDKHGLKLTDDELNSIGLNFDIDTTVYDGSAKQQLVF